MRSWTPYRVDGKSEGTAPVKCQACLELFPQDIWQQAQKGIPPDEEAVNPLKISDEVWAKFRELHREDEVDRGEETFRVQNKVEDERDRDCAAKAKHSSEMGEILPAIMFPGPEENR